MKRSKYKQILDETSITLKESRNVVIDRLIQQNGSCRSNDTYGGYLCFRCDKNGRFRVDDSGNSRYSDRYRTHYVEGEVLEENGKTVVKIYSVHSKMLKIVRYVTTIIAAIYCICAFILMSYLDSGISTKLVVAVLPVAFVYFIVFSRMNKESKNKSVDFEIMKQEVINRVEAVKLWDK